MSSTEKLALFEDKTITFHIKEKRAGGNSSPILPTLAGYGLILAATIIAGFIYMGILALIPGGYDYMSENEMLSAILGLALVAVVLVCFVPVIKRLERKFDSIRYEAKRSNEKHLQAVILEQGFRIPNGYDKTLLHKVTFEDVETGVLYRAASVSYYGMKADTITLFLTAK